MITIIIKNIITKKNYIIISCLLILYLVFIISIIPKNDGNSYFYFYKTDYIKNFLDIVLQISSIIVFITMFLILIEHDQSYLNNITTYKGRSYVFLRKLMAYILILISILASLFIITIVSLLLLNFSCNTLYKTMFTFTKLTVDNIILVVLMLLLVNKKHKIFGYILLIYYILSVFIGIDEYGYLLYYLLPFNNKRFDVYMYNDLYKLVYIIFIAYLGSIKYKLSDLQ